MSDDDEDYYAYDDDDQQIHMQDVCDIVEPTTTSNLDGVSTMVELVT